MVWMWRTVEGGRSWRKTPPSISDWMMARLTSSARLGCGVNMAGAWIRVMGFRRGYKGCLEFFGNVGSRAFGGRSRAFNTEATGDHRVRQLPRENAVLKPTFFSIAYAAQAASIVGGGVMGAALDGGVARPHTVFQCWHFSAGCLVLGRRASPLRLRSGQAQAGQPRRLSPQGSAITGAGWRFGVGLR